MFCTVAICSGVATGGHRWVLGFEEFVWGLGWGCKAIVCYLINVLYCSENMFVSCRLSIYVWLQPPDTAREVSPEPLCPPYLQTLATPLDICVILFCSFAFSVAFYLTMLRPI